MEKIFEKHKFFMGRIIGSKSGYRNQFPDNYVLFNANIFTPFKHKVWYGDLDITLDAKNLQKVCDEIGEEMIVVSEMKGSFGAEEMKYKKIRKMADVIFKPNRDYYELLETEGFDSFMSGIMTIVIGKPKKWNKINY